MILGAIQAHTGSTRLPGKVLLPLFGKPMLQHIVERIQRSAGIDETVVICPMKDFGVISDSVSCKVFADSEVGESDLIGRYWSVARAFRADLVVRICSDNPCADPVNIDNLIGLYLKKFPPRDWILTNAGDAPNSIWPQSLGAEVYSYPTLEWMDEKLRESPELCEHPHQAFHDCNRFTEPLCPFDWEAPLRFDVNTREDYERMVSLYNYFGNNTFTSFDLIAYEVGV